MKKVLGIVLAVILALVAFCCVSAIVFWEVHVEAGLLVAVLIGIALFPMVASLIFAWIAVLAAESVAD